ncbi:hypothetical protein BH11ARM2_BH11ARM2_03080 [soil metagenome]
MEIPQELEGVLVSTPDTLHGAVRFAGTRVFAYQLFDYILSGHTLDEFLNDFEGVGRDQTQSVLEWERARLHRQLQPTG